MGDLLVEVVVGIGGIFISVFVTTFWALIQNDMCEHGLNNNFLC